MKTTIAILASTLLFGGCAALGTAIERVNQQQIENPAPVNDDPVEWAQWIVAAMLAASGVGTVGGAGLYRSVLRPRRIAREMRAEAARTMKYNNVTDSYGNPPPRPGSTVTPPARRGPDLS